MLITCKQAEEPGDSLPPEENRFVRSVLTQPGQLDEPMVMSFLKDGRILLIERKGNLKAFNPATSEVITIATIPVNTKYTSREGQVTEAEEGLMGLIAHPDFDKNHWIYLYYADPSEPKHVLARWELHGDSLYASTKKIVLEIPTQRETCCHTGGGMVFDKAGNLFLTVGNNTGNPANGTAGFDERAGRESWDDQRAAGSTNDLRGKILRIHPEDDGSYTIPEGNLFPKGTDKTLPEIYTMGHRNPWRISMDSKTGYIYWGEVGPDASRDSTIGPKGYDEFNQARQAGFFGWPYFIGDNIPYSHYNYETGVVGEKFNAAQPVNNSPNNTGLKELPLPQKALIWYPYSNSEEFPLVGSSGRSATGGPVFRKTDFKNASRPFPSYYEGKWFIVEFMRGWIMVVTMDGEGNYKSMERFLPNENFSSAIDMQFGPEGDLYVLEYGSAWFRGNDNARIVKIEYNGGNRKPIVAANADKLAGALPLQVKLSSAGTTDYDKYDRDALTYEWKLESSNGYKQTIQEANPVVTFDEAGEYLVTLTVTDTKGESNYQAVKIQAGNDAPVVELNILRGNKTFYFENSTIDYEIAVNDKEDGTLGQGIPHNEVAVNFDYAPEGFDLIEIASTHRSTDEWITFSAGLNLINKSDCKSCHLDDKKSVGPSYLDIANRYKGDRTAQEKLAQKIIMGGGGVWGDHAMAAHPQVTPPQAANMVKYIMSITDTKQTVKEIPLKGTFTMKAPADDNKRGGYLLRVAYKDKGTSVMQPITSEKILALRNPVLDPELHDVSYGTQLFTTPSRSFSMVGDQSYLGYKNIDFTGIRQIELMLQAQPRSGAIGGTVEIHLDSPDGPLVGKSEQIVPKEIDFMTAIQLMQQEQQKNNKNKPKANSGSDAPSAASIDFNALRKFMSDVIKVPVNNIQGTHDVYFVFRNPEADENKILVQMVEIQFQNRIDPTGK
ncbi:MAG: PQQ-dependent sugar dehydrogenase [Cyclobacteriaceae bacterium]|nr:PQQ-dependent sugar dehydrogenase [Cyclobacteriaceae bacterium]